MVQTFISYFDMYTLAFNGFPPCREAPRFPSYGCAILLGIAITIFCPRGGLLEWHIIDNNLVAPIVIGLPPYLGKGESGGLLHNDWI